MNNINKKSKTCNGLYTEYLLLNSTVGPTGPTGPAGETPNFEIGNVLTGPPGSSADVTIRRIFKKEEKHG